MTDTVITSVEELKPIIEQELRLFHYGKQHRAEKWDFVQKVCGVIIPERERNNNNSFERRVRQAMSELRKAKVLVCSDPKGGYWMAANLEEALSVSEEFRSRARDMLMTARELREEARREFGRQLRLM